MCLKTEYKHLSCIHKNLHEVDLDISVGHDLVMRVPTI